MANPGNAQNPFPRDTEPKRLYRVKKGRSLYFGDSRVYPAGTLVVLADKRVEAKRHVVELVDRERTMAGAAGGRTRGMRARRRE